MHDSLVSDKGARAGGDNDGFLHDSPDFLLRRKLRGISPHLRSDFGEVRSIDSVSLTTMLGTLLLRNERRLSGERRFFTDLLGLSTEPVGGASLVGCFRSWACDSEGTLDNDEFPLGRIFPSGED